MAGTDPFGQPSGDCAGVSFFFGRKMKHYPNKMQLRDIFDYDAEDGALLWKKRSDVRNCTNARYAGKKAGKIGADGYVSIKIDGGLYMAHRLIWIMHHGDLSSDEQIDHANRIKVDNRLQNLRRATSSQNNHNKAAKVGCTSTFKGVHWSSGKRKWRAQIKIGGKLMHLGYFFDEAAAAKTYDAKASELYGDFAALNFPEGTASNSGGDE